jgi:flagellin
MITINLNTAASRAGLNLGKSQEALSASLERLSSGRRIVDPSDDAGGLAVHMKMAAAQKRTEATAINLRNARSFLEVQDGAFQVADKTTSRMSELFALARDVTKNRGDVENYNKEIENLKAQLISLKTEKFNGVNLFEGDSLTVPTSEDGTQTTTVTSAAINSNPMMDLLINGFKTFNIPGNGGVIRNFVAAKNADAGGPMTVYELPSGTKYQLDVSRTEAPADFEDFSDVDGFGVYSYEYKYEATLTGYTVDVNGNESLAEDPDFESRKFTAIQKLQGGGTAPNFNPPAAWSEVDDNLLFNQTDLIYENSAAYANISALALQELADMRAQNGAEMSRINFAEDMLRINAVNLEAANSRIIDVDVAAESTQLARYQILQQAGTAMLAQANTSQQSLVRLLQA